MLLSSDATAGARKEGKPPENVAVQLYPEPFSSGREYHQCRRLLDTSRACAKAMESIPLGVSIGSGRC